MKQKPSKKPKQLSSYVRFSGIAVQMGAIIGLGAWGGSSLDKKFNFDKPIFTIVLSLLGVAIALYIVIREVIKMGKDVDE